MKCNTLVSEGEVRRFPFRHIESVKSPDGRVLGSNREMHNAHRVHFRDRFARCPDIPVQEFRSYLTDFLRLREAEAASCEGLVYGCVELVGLSNRPDLMVYPTNCTWRCRTFLWLFWRICSTIGSPRELSLGALQKHDHIAEDRWQECLEGARRLQFHNYA